MDKIDKAHKVAKWLHDNGYCPSLPSPDGRTWADVLYPEVEPEKCEGHNMSWIYIKPPLEERSAIGYHLAMLAIRSCPFHGDKCECPEVREMKQKVLRGEKVYCKDGIHRRYDKTPFVEFLVTLGLVSEKEVEEVATLVSAIWLARWGDCPNCGRRI